MSFYDVQSDIRDKYLVSAIPIALGIVHRNHEVSKYSIRNIDEVNYIEIPTILRDYRTEFVQIASTGKKA